LHSSTSP